MKTRFSAILTVLLMGISMSCAENTPYEEGKPVPEPIERPAPDAPEPSDDVPMSGKVNLWEKGNIPTVSKNANNSDGPDFIPNLEVFTVDEQCSYSTRGQSSSGFLLLGHKGRLRRSVHPKRRCR